MPYPREYFTPERLSARRLNQPPRTLFHFTPMERAFKILESGELRGRPQISLTENPAMSAPGPIVFMLDSPCVMKSGFWIWPTVWQRGYESEAEWAITNPGGEEYDDARVMLGPVRLPLTCVIQIGFQPGISRHLMEQVPDLNRAAMRWGIPVEVYYWDEWWSNGVRR